MCSFTQLSLLLLGGMVYSSAALHAQTCTSGECTNGYGTYTFSTGETYVGYFSGGLRNGQGTFTWPNGNKYVGESTDDVFQGQGTFYTAGGDRYVGHFYGGKRNGYGTYYWSTGIRYEGYWSDDQIDGSCTMTYPSGEVKKGYWKSGIYSGSAAETQADGSSYDADAFCIAVNRIKDQMDNNFDALKGKQFTDDKKNEPFWSSTETLPGSTASVIEGETDLDNSYAYFQFAKYSSFDAAKKKYDELKEQLESCMPEDWYDDEDTDASDGSVSYMMDDDAHFNGEPGKYNSLEVNKDKKDELYYVEIYFGNSK